MKRNFIFVLLILFGWQSLSMTQSLQPKRTTLIEISLDEKEQKDLEAMKIKFVTGLIEGKALLITSKNELKVLEERGYKFKKIMSSKNEIDLYRRALYGKSMRLDPVYHTYKEIIDELNNLKSQYAEFVKLHQIGVTSQLKQPIWAVKISDNASEEEDEPAILFSGCIHSDELIGTEICMSLIHYLMTHYNSDLRVKKWVNENEIWFIPVINVDGHGVVTKGIDPRWRKNLRDNNQNGVLYEKEDGIDLNRNFDFNWAHGGSSDPKSERYRGERPFSESECLAVRDLALEQKFVLSVTYHSQGEVIYYPWDWRGRKAPDDKLLTKIAHGLASSITTMDGDTTYVPFYGAGTVGQTYPWLYGVVGTFDFIVETGKGRHIFPAEDLKKIVAANLAGAFFMLDQMAGPGVKVKIVDARTGAPVSAEVWFPGIETEDIHRRYSDSKHGTLYRRLNPGNYRLIVRKDGYESVVLKNVTVGETSWTEVDIKLKNLE
ncbi:hypothetical protein B6D60_07550 [candidate division KSB1 bacterium 4484_87]|nr:MAG: hypothetical protein B6D60_07550 [candidate division KSB1 bacterium 4484_87]